MKTLLTVDKLIIHMDEKGIKFNIVNKDAAKAFLTNNNYYKKFSSYRKNYTQAPDLKGVKKYQNLEFAYLQELSRIDLRLRYLIMQVCLDIEHAMKVEILNNAVILGDDGYKIVKKFLEKYSDVAKRIHEHSTSPYCSDLITRYEHNYPIWVILEVVSFGDLCKFFKCFSENFKELFKNPDIVFNVRELRNAAAHSHCLINDLRNGNAKPLPVISQFVSAISDIQSSTRKSRLSNHFINDFISTLYFYDFIVKSDGAKQHTYEEINSLFNNRMLRNKEYFLNNMPIKNTYNFTKKIVDKIINNAYNISMNLKNE